MQRPLHSTELKWLFTDKYPPVGTILQAEDRLVATTEDKAKTSYDNRIDDQRHI